MIIQNTEFVPIEKMLVLEYKCGARNLDKNIDITDNINNKKLWNEISVLEVIESNNESKYKPGMLVLVQLSMLASLNGLFEDKLITNKKEIMYCPERFVKCIVSVK